MYGADYGSGDHSNSCQPKKSWRECMTFFWRLRPEETSANTAALQRLCWIIEVFNNWQVLAVASKISKVLKAESCMQKWSSSEEKCESKAGQKDLWWCRTGGWKFQCCSHPTVWITCEKAAASLFSCFIRHGAHWDFLWLKKNSLKSVNCQVLFQIRWCLKGQTPQFVFVDSFGWLQPLCTAWRSSNVKWR